MGRFTVAEDKDIDRDPASRRTGEEPAGTEGLVVGMRRDDDQPGEVVEVKRRRSRDPGSAGPGLLGSAEVPVAEDHHGET
ncbi:hypothetical protein QN357_19275, partial [Cryobacterium sp. RTC2.1]|uniref:hypothetical protein n=1 Tax=Cryobacterium sp. RTC2.1 TaxID=3048634 RepID=UPI002B235D5F